MRAAIFHKKGEIGVEDIPVRIPGPDDIVVNVKVCGVCGTDLHIFEGADGAAKVTPPLVLGHEFSGVVCQTGSRVKDLKAGDRVGIDPNDMCGECYFCRLGRNNFCESFTGTGTTVNGGFAEYVTVRAKQAYKIPDSMDFEEAAMLEPLSCCLNGLDLTEIRAGDTVLVIGGGPIGQIMLQLAKYSGAGKVILSEPVEQKRNMALKLGADILVDPFREKLQDILESHNIKNINRVIECVGSGETVKYAVENAGRGAAVMVFGLTDPSCEVAIKPYELFRKELTIRSSFINPYTFERAVSLLASGRINVRDIITDRVKLDDIAKVFTDISYRKKGKVVITP